MSSCANSSLAKVLLQQLRRIEAKLDNPRTGLAEIKSEVAVVEGAVTNPCFGLKEIAEGVAGIEDFLCDIDLEKLECVLDAIHDGVEDIEAGLDAQEECLEEIKEEVDDIGEAVQAIGNALECLDPGAVKGVIECIAHEVDEIEDKIENPEFGLAEIKQEVKEVECLLQQADLGNLPCLLEHMKEAVCGIEDVVMNPEFGLCQIEKEVKGIECLLKELDLKDVLCLLARIKAEICQIESALTDPCTGLAEIKREIQEILEKLEECCDGNGPVESERVTSGPMFRANQASSVIAQALNYGEEEVTVTIRVFNVPLTGPKTEVSGSPVVVVIQPGESFAQAFDISGLVSYEVQFETQSPRFVRYWSGSRTQPANVALTSTTLVPENIVLHEDFVPVPPIG